MSGFTAPVIKEGFTGELSRMAIAAGVSMCEQTVTRFSRRSRR
jgi:hypothetical protein